MVRVLHVVSAMNRGGLETFIMNLYRNVDRSKVQFDFLVHTENKGDYDDEIKSMGGKIYSIPSRSSGIYKNYKAVNSFFKDHEEYNVVHQHASSLTYIEPLKAAKKYGVTTRIIHSHSTRLIGNPIHKLFHLLNRLLIEFYVTDYFACSDLAARWLLGEEKYKQNKYTIINNGIEPKDFKFNPRIRNEYRDKLKINNKFVIGHVGRFSYPKNHNFLLDIFKAFNDKKPESILLLVGDGELLNNSIKKCKELGLEGKVVFLGLRSDISNLLQAMDAFVFPSHYEGLPVALVEAQSAGLLCFVSDSITKQINITQLVNNISLNSTADFWANCIIDKSENQKRFDTTEIIKSNGFDIRVVANSLMEYYMSNSREKK